MELAEGCKAAAAAGTIDDGGVQAHLYRGCRLNLADTNNALNTLPPVQHPAAP